MNYKKNGRNEEVSAPEVSLEHQGKLNNPLDKIRKNMKMEFWMSIMTIVPLFRCFVLNRKSKLNYMYVCLLFRWF